MSEGPGEVTRILHRLAAGESAAEAELFDRLHAELRRLAAAQMRRERATHTLSPTALVSEIYLRLTGTWGQAWQGKTHFMAVAARAMRRVLVDHARAASAGKRLGQMEYTDLDQLSDGLLPVDERILAVDAALTRLAVQDPRKAKVVELRYFAGQTEEQTAAILNVTRRTVNRDWEFARAWLRRELQGNADDR
jgi:RNA polymerase sigma-70 factor, ECF subfamily